MNAPQQFVWKPSFAFRFYYFIFGQKYCLPMTFVNRFFLVSKMIQCKKNACYEFLSFICLHVSSMKIYSHKGSGDWNNVPPCYRADVALRILKHYFIFAWVVYVIYCITMFKKTGFRQPFEQPIPRQNRALGRGKYHFISTVCRVQ